jgi:alkanesulfonate monooxygenase SsuD/methylene tetrahydromethanopterin reductase-like flavin-dependent oxidoreductase (luciferase family)
VLKGLFGPAPLTFAGTQVEALDGLPNRVQRPWPPLLIGAS